MKLFLISAPSGTNWVVRSDSPANAITRVHPLLGGFEIAVAEVSPSQADSWVSGGAILV